MTLNVHSLLFEKYVKAPIDHGIEVRECDGVIRVRVKREGYPLEDCIFYEPVSNLEGDERLLEWFEKTKNKLSGVRAAWCLFLFNLPISSSLYLLQPEEEKASCEGILISILFHILP